MVETTYTPQGDENDRMAVADLMNTEKQLTPRKGTVTSSLPARPSPSLKHITPRKGTVIPAC